MATAESIYTGTVAFLGRVPADVWKYGGAFLAGVLFGGCCL